jgi:hypothetical protein
MGRTRLESVALVWHCAQVAVGTFVLATHHFIGTTWSSPSALAYIVLAVGWFLAGALIRPNALALLLAFAYWAMIAIQISAAYLQWDASMGVRVALKIWPDPKLSVDLVASIAAMIFLQTWRQRRLTIGSSDRGATSSMGQGGSR